MTLQRDRMRLLEQVLESIVEDDQESAIALVARWMISRRPEAGRDTGRLLVRQIDELRSENAELRRKLFEAVRG
jgi:hypothetical protein